MLSTVELVKKKLKNTLESEISFGIGDLITDLWFLQGACEDKF